VREKSKSKKQESPTSQGLKPVSLSGPVAQQSCMPPEMLGAELSVRPSNAGKELPARGVEINQQFHSTRLSMPDQLNFFNHKTRLLVCCLWVNLSHIYSQCGIHLKLGQCQFCLAQNTAGLNYAG
jgi:hypothetical protein